MCCMITYMYISMYLLSMYQIGGLRSQKTCLFSLQTALWKFESTPGLGPIFHIEHLKTGRVSQPQQTCRCLWTNTALDKNSFWRVSFQSSNSVAGKQLLVLDCRANARRQKTCIFTDTCVSQIWKQFPSSCITGSMQAPCTFETNKLNKHIDVMEGTTLPYRQFANQESGTRRVWLEQVLKVEFPWSTGTSRMSVGTCVGGGFKGSGFKQLIIASCVWVATVLFAMLLSAAYIILKPPPMKQAPAQVLNLDSAIVTFRVLSLRNIAEYYFHVELRIRNMLQALLSFTGDSPQGGRHIPAHCRHRLFGPSKTRLNEPAIWRNASRKKITAMTHGSFGCRVLPRCAILSASLSVLPFQPEQDAPHTMLYYPILCYTILYNTVLRCELPYW